MGILSEAGTANPSPAVFFCGIRTHLFSFLCCVVLCFALFVFSCVLSTQCCQCLWIVHFLLHLRFSLMFISFQQILRKLYSNSMSFSYIRTGIFLPVVRKIILKIKSWMCKCCIKPHLISVVSQKWNASSSRRSSISIVQTDVYFIISIFCDNIQSK